jgi:aminoacyl tRNA synthase complex-interacting multifunctional protein 1
MTVSSGALLATLSVSKSVLEKDKLLALVAGLAPRLQLTLKVDTSKKASATATLELYNGTTMTYRNAVLRTMCTFFRQLDYMPYCLMGGASSYGNAATAEHQATLASISSWMSYATSLASHIGGPTGSEQVSTTLVQLNDYLASRSFLVPSAMVTLADLSVYYAMLDLSIGVDHFKEQGLSNLLRWWNQTQATVASLMAEVASNKHNAKWLVDHAELFIAPAGTVSQPSPMFFYGHEESLVAVAAAVNEAPASKSVAKTAAKGSPAAAGAEAKVGGGGGGGLTEEEKKAAAEKKAKKNAEKAAKKEKNKIAGGGGDGGKDGATPAADYDITALDIRVGLITKAWNHETADKLYCEEIDLGPELGTRKIASGLRPFYKLEEMQNKRVLVLCNLKSRSLVGFPSHGMVMCASNADHTKVEFVTAPPEAKLGERVLFEGFDDKPPEAENKVAKKKVFEKLSPDLKTDAEGNIVWKGAKAITSAGVCHAVSKMPDAQVA